MKIKYQFTVAYLLCFIIIALVVVFWAHKPLSNENKAALLYGPIFIIVFGGIVSLIIEAILLLVNEKFQGLMRFIIMFVALDFIFYSISRIEIVSGLIELQGQRFQTVIPLVVCHLICYAIASVTLFAYEKYKKGHENEKV
jgi:hypothetical protein